MDLRHQSADPIPPAPSLLVRNQLQSSSSLGSGQRSDGSGTKGIARSTANTTYVTFFEFVPLYGMRATKGSHHSRKKLRHNGGARSAFSRSVSYGGRCVVLNGVRSCSAVFVTL